MRVILVRKFYFYLLLFNLTSAANEWSILGLGIGQLTYWFLLFFSIVVLFETNYFIIGTCLAFMTLVLKICNAFIGVPYTGMMSEFTSGFIFILAGACLYGSKPSILYRQLLSFLALSIPFMIIQKIGFHVFFYGWSTEVFHENGTFLFDEIKDKGNFFKRIPLFPTVFVELKDLNYVIYQGRHTGLLYSNNVLSVIISFALALHFSIFKPIIGNYKYFTIATIIVLAASNLVYGVFSLLFIHSYFFRRNKYLKSNALKTFRFILVMLFFHYVFFPGMTSNSFGFSNQLSFVYRFGEIFYALGFNYFDNFISVNNIKIDFDGEDSFSLVGALVKSKFIFVYFILFLFYSIFYYRALKAFESQSFVYLVLFIVSILTQFAINFVGAPIFQVFLGIALYPTVRPKLLRAKIQSIYSSSPKLYHR